MSYLDLEESISMSMHNNFGHYFGSTFIRTPSFKSYTIDSEDVFTCIDRLKINENQIVIGFDIYWDYYLDKQPQLKKDEDNNYAYNNVRILNLKTGSEIVSQQLYVLNKDEMPYLSFVDPNKDLVERYFNKPNDKHNNVWLSLQKVKDNPDLISESERKRITDNPEDMSVLAAFLQAQCHWGEGIRMIKVKIKHKFIDNGNCDDVSLVKPFNEK